MTHFVLTKRTILYDDKKQCRESLTCVLTCAVSVLIRREGFRGLCRWGIQEHRCCSYLGHVKWHLEAGANYKELKQYKRMALMGTEGY